MSNRKKIAIIAGFILTALIAGGIFSRNVRNSEVAGKVDLTPPRSSVTINKDYNFLITNEQGAQVGTFIYTIQNADLQDEIVVQGQKSTAVNGRTFLIINLKINNTLDKPISINSRDYVRLSVNGNDQEWLAPEIHNDPVEVQGQSTKFTRIGFSVNERDGNYRLRIGELSGNKETLPLDLKY